MDLLYVLIIVGIILLMVFIVFGIYFITPEASAERDKLFKDGVKEVMSGGNKIILKGEIRRTIPQTEGEWAEYHEYIKDSRIHRCEGLIDPRGIF